MLKVEGCLPLHYRAQDSEIPLTFSLTFLFFFSLSLSHCQLSLISIHSGPAPFHLSDVWLLVRCRLKFHHLEYFAYPKVIYLASSIIQSTRQEPESKTSPQAAQIVSVAS